MAAAIQTMRAGILRQGGMGDMMKKLALILFAAVPLVTLPAQQKYALVIGNGAYAGITRLNNPVNDAVDVSAALRDLGFIVDTVTDAGRVHMEEAVTRLRNRLASARDSYGFFYYAGHGVQSGGENYLIPVDANIPSETYLRDRSVPIQAVLDELNSAGNALNIVVLDACRDNPFGWSRSGSRGLSMVSRQPADSIIVYATSAGSAAQDGTGRNGLFTSHLLNNLNKPDLSVRDMFYQTGADVQRASDRAQVPAIYSQFFGVAYLGNRPAVNPIPVRPAAPPSRRPAASGGVVFGYGLLNLGLGAGSFVQGDWGGGLTLLGGYGAAAGLVAWELSLNYDDSIAGIPGSMGLGVAGITVIYGFIRPILYNRNRALAGIVDGIRISTAPENRGGEKVRLSYTVKF